MIKQIVYVSRATIPFSDSAVLSLLEEAQERNNESKITGFLAYDGEYFFQLLEGDFEKVDETLGRIVQDKRHGSLDVILSQLSEERLLPNWSMRQVIFKEQGEDIKTKIRSFFNEGKKTLDPHELKKMVLAIRFPKTEKRKVS